MDSIILLSGKRGNMRLVNRTNIDDDIILHLARRAGISGYNVRITIIYNSKLPAPYVGTCQLFTPNHYLIMLKHNYDIPTLAHELKHAAFDILRGYRPNSGGEEKSCKFFEERYK